MSIKAKLAWFISLTVTVVLLLNISIYYFNSKVELQSSAEQQMLVIAKQIGQSMDTAQQSRRLIESGLGEKLRLAAIAAQNQLDPDIANVSNEELETLSKQLGVDDITLWVRTRDDIVAVKSSDPAELNISSKTWGYWYTAFNQLFDLEPVTIKEGQKLSHFWSGPINYATSNPSHINKWGSYYDGTTNYMINPFINADLFMKFEETSGSEAIAAQVLKDNSSILEVTGFNTEFVGKKPIIKIKKGMPIYNLDVRSVIFGNNDYIGRNDNENIMLAESTGEVVTARDHINGHEVLKSFVPIVGQSTTVIGITFDLGTIQKTLLRQLSVQALISLGLILFTAAASSFLAAFIIRSLNQILSKVNEIAQGNFGVQVAVTSSDELGLLASRVNTMSHNLQTYTTQLKDANEEIRHTKQYLESFVNHTSDAIHVSDLSGYLIQINTAFETIYGWSEQEALGTKLDNIPEEYRKEFEELLDIVKNGGSITDQETVRYSKNGNPIDVSLTISPIRNESGDIVAIATISRNITARKHTEEVLRRSEKLSVVGQLAAGVAHEVRNPLTTLRGFVQLLQQNEKLTPAYFDIMLAELDRINFIISEFLVVAKPQAVHFQLINVRDTLRDIVMLLDSEANFNNVRLVTYLDEQVPLVMGEVNQLKQVFLNVMKNGIESMSNGGELTIELRYAPPEGILIRITDQGSGIAEPDLSRLCEPFFTRKEEGTGLGLMVSQQIIDNHKGSMHFKSQLDVGTIVEIKLPLPPAAATAITK
ncbi:ATP-binding protein [Paenibacillus sp. NPDC058174]|uniref:ATP-binding protein n=1 Tax=Paenibacillus sp. NPDC058174 TaxID=3346366 RepID=UPI0036D8A6EB